MHQKENALRRLNEAKALGEVDADIIPLLDYINSLPDYYTTSSCSGRICLLHDLGSKFDDNWVGKWHRKVTFDEVMEAFSMRPKTGRIRFMFEPAILHIVAKDIDKANKLVTVARNFGFKKAGIITVKEFRNVVEVCSTERIDAPIAEKGVALVSPEYINYLVDLANVRFSSGLRRLKRLEQGLKNTSFS